MREHKIIEEGGRLYLACKKCGVEKELTSEFWRKESKLKSGFNPICKSCRKIIDEIYREKHRERIRQNSRKYARKYHLEHREEEREYRKQYRELHKEEMKERAKEYREINKDRLREYKRERWVKDKETRKKWYDDNKTIILRKSKERVNKKGYLPAHWKVNYVKNKLGLNPTTCSLCGHEGQIVAHHPNYNKPYDVVFCCQSCHRLIHNGDICISNDKIVSLDKLYELKKKKGKKLIRKS